MRARLSFVLPFCIALVPAQLALSPSIATGGRLKSTQPACPLKCPAGFTEGVFSYELHPERTIYDDAGKTIVPPDAVWKVTCGLKCEQHAVNQETKSWKSEPHVLCRSGAEPGPYKGPWRITGQFSRECSTRFAKDCNLHCYEIKAPPPAKKKK